jgi:hypothetical protein
MKYSIASDEESNKNAARAERRYPTLALLLRAPGGAKLVRAQLMWSIGRSQRAVRKEPLR